MNRSDQIADIVIQWKKEQQEMEKQIIAPNPHSFSELKRKKILMTPDEDMARVNPNQLRSGSFRINCAYCTAAYDLRRRGYDVEADDYHNGSTLDESVNTVHEIFSWWTHDHNRVTNPGYRYLDLPKRSCNELMNYIVQKEGNSRGQMSFMWKTGKAHSVIYEIQYGAIVLRDCQINKRVSFERYAYISDRLYYFRTDNEQPTPKILNCLKNKISDSKKTVSLFQRLRNAGFTTYRYNDDTVKVYPSDTHDLYLLIKSDGTIKTRFLLDDARFVK